MLKHVCRIECLKGNRLWERILIKCCLTINNLVELLFRNI